MKINKIKTRMGEFGSPVSTGISAIVELMRSQTTKEVAARIAATVLQQRLAIQKGAASESPVDSALQEPRQRHDWQGFPK